MSLVQVVQSQQQLPDSPGALVRAEPVPRARALRLQLTPSPNGSGTLDGAWWPYSRDLAVEALDLVDRFPAWFGRICRVTYSTPDWDHVGRRRIRAEKVFVTLGSFPLDDTHLVLLTSVSGVQPLQLLVVPSEWTVHAAHRSMRAAADPTNVLSGPTILEKFRRRTMPDRHGGWLGDGGVGDVA